MKKSQNVIKGRRVERREIHKAKKVAKAIEKPERLILGARKRWKELLKKNTKLENSEQFLHFMDFLHFLSSKALFKMNSSIHLGNYKSILSLPLSQSIEH